MDTLRQILFFPHTYAATPSGSKLRGAASQLIPCWGEKMFDLSFQGRHCSWIFLLAPVSFPIIGVDFLCHFKLIVDPEANALVNKCSAESFATVSALTAAASADSGPPPTAQLTVPQSPVHSHWSSVTSPQSPVRSHRSPAVYNIHRCRRRRQPSQLAVLKRCWQNFLRWSTPLRRYSAAPLAVLSTTSSPRDRRCPVAFVAWTARN